MIQFRSHVSSGFNELPSSALALLAAAPTYDLTQPWLERLARHTLAPNEASELLWLGDETDATALALLPLVRGEGTPSAHGRSLRALANYYSNWFTALSAPGADRAVLGAALARSLTSDAESWDSLDLNPMDPTDACFEALEGALRAGGCFVQRYFRFGNWYLEVGGRSFAQYLGSLPSRLQNTLKRKGKKLEQLGEVRYEIVQTSDRVDAAMSAHEEVYAKSWKQGVEGYPAFLRDVAHAFAERGWLRLGVLWIGERAAATQIWFAYGGTASIFKLAYDPDYTEHSAGSLLTAHLMRQVIDVDGVRIVDYLSGDDSYKQDWMSARRERWGLRVYRLSSVAGLAGAARSVAGDLARRGLSAMRRSGSRSAS